MLRRNLQRRVAVKLQKCYMDYETSLAIQFRLMYIHFLLQMHMST